MNLSKSVCRRKRSSFSRSQNRLALETLESRWLLASVIQVRAAGATGEESMALTIDGQTVQSWDNIGGDFNSAAFDQYNYIHPTDVQPNQVRVEFTNDGAATNGTDRDLRVDGITIDGTVYESEAPSVLSTGTWDTSCSPGNKQSEFLHCGGYFQYAGSTIDVFAAGATGEETIALLINGQSVATWNNIQGDYDNGTYITRSYQHPTRIAPSQIRVAFTNDGTSATGGDRNVRIDAIRLDGATYQSEAPNVFSQGSWDAATACGPGNKSSEFLHCNGYLQYAGSQIEIRAAGATGEEAIALQVDNQTVQSWTNVGGDYSSREFESLVFYSPATVSIEQIQVAFTNDGNTSSGVDRNVRVDAVIVDGIVFEAEASSVLSTGTWQPNDGCAPGNKSSEFLHCGGSFQFNVNSSPGTLALGGSLFSVNEEVGSIDVPFVRTGGSDGQVTLDFTTINGSANNDDFTPISGTVVFQPGETQKFVTIPITDDNRSEGNETFSVSADAVGGGAALGQPRTATITIVDDDQGPNPGTGNGLLGLYFDDVGLGQAVFERTDTTVDFNWGAGSPDARIAPDTFSVRWDGQVEPLYSQTYTFYTTSDDGVRLWVDNQRIIDNWTDHSSTVDSGTITLQAGTRYDIRMELYERGGDALAKLEWASPSQARQVIPQLQLYSDLPSNITGTFSGQTVISGLNKPTAIEFAAGNKMFIAQQNGVVRLAENGSLRSTPFIDISSQVNGVRDRGLLGLEVHPEFPSQPYVYLSFTYDPPEAASFPSNSLASRDQIGNRVARVIRVSANPNTNYRTAINGSEVVLLGKNSTWQNISRPDRDSTNDFSIGPSCAGVSDCIPADSQSHTIGALAFGTDGSLFVSSGDGTSYGRVDPRTVRVQSLDSLSGKILRINPITGAGYTDNPFYNGNVDADRSKVYNYGLRNPFRMAVHPELNRPYVGDVGWTAWEEINSARGANFGWPYYEGGNGQNLRTGGYRDLPEAQAFYTSGGSATPPLWSRPHSDGARAIVAGDFYSGSRYPNLLDNALFFSDYGEPTVRSLILNPDGSVNRVQQISGNVGILVGMTNGPDGYMYYVDIVGGRVGRFVYTETASNQASQAAIPNGGASSGIVVVQSGKNVDVYAKDSDDEIEFDLNRPEIVTINSVEHALPLGATRVNIHGRGGNDHVRVTGTAGEHYARIEPTKILVRAPDVVLTAFDTESGTVDGIATTTGQAAFFDGTTDDLWRVRPDSASLRYGTSDATTYFANGFERYVAYTDAGGFDRAYLYDSSRDDVFRAYPDYAMMASGAYFVRANDFEWVHAIADSGGDFDRAYFHDSLGDDSYRATSRLARMMGEDYQNYASRFERTFAYATQGNDVARLNDSDGDDRFMAYADRAIMVGAAFRNEIRGFSRTYGVASAGGNDRAVLFDSVGDDRLLARKNYAFLSGEGFDNRAIGFETVIAKSVNGGTDRVDSQAIDFILRTDGPWS